MSVFEGLRLHERLAILQAHPHVFSDLPEHLLDAWLAEPEPEQLRIYH